MEDTEKIKNLSTAGDYKIEAKGKDRREIEFFAKFVLCSNNERNPIIIPKEEVRFWVRKINLIEKDNIHLRGQMAEAVNDIESALSEYRKALKKSPTHARSRSL